MRRLIELIRLRKKKGERYILLLGNGASISSGVPPWEKIIEEIIRMFGSGSTATREELYNILDRCTALDRVLILEEHIAGKRPSRGYGCLAQLIKNNYFFLIFTTNFDPYLEDSLMDIGLRPGHDFIKLIVSVRKEEQILEALTYEKPKTKILKLHGDLLSRHIAITREETFQFHEEIEKVLKTYFTQNDVIIFGHGMRDIDLNRCIRKKGRSIWYINKSRPKPEDWITQAMVVRRSANNIISNDEANFDNFFCILANAFGLPIPPLLDAHFMLKEQYSPRRVTIPYSPLEGIQRQVDCCIKEVSPSTTPDFGDYVKLKVHLECERCPRCTENEKTPIDYSFEVGWSDKFTGSKEITCNKGHKFLVSKRLTWMIDR